MALSGRRRGRAADGFDDTLRIVRPAHRRWLGWAMLAGVALVVAGTLGWMEIRQPTWPRASETQIFRHVGRRFTVFRFRDDPLVLVVDCPDLHAQGLMFDRIAALIEKANAPRDRVLSEAAFRAALAAAGSTVGTYYYGNDYSARGLRRFFRLAQSEHLGLDPQEERLHRIVRRAGFLRPGATGAVISIPQAASGHRVGLRSRAVILRHELSHGAYFTLPVYRSFVNRFYNNVMKAPERAGFADFLARQGYDAHDHGLIVNETLAYLVFTRDREFFRASAAGLSHSRVAALREKFIAGMPDIWLKPLATQPLPHR